MTIETRTETDFYHDVAVTVGDVNVHVRAKHVEYRRVVAAVEKGCVWRIASAKDRRFDTLPTTYAKWDNAVLRDAQEVQLSLAMTLQRKKAAAALLPLLSAPVDAL